MATSREGATAPESKTPRRNLFGPPPVIKGEDAADYEKLHARVSNGVRPTDFIEEIWIWDIVDATWTLIRLRRIQTAFLTAQVSDVAHEEAWRRADGQPAPEGETEEEEHARVQAEIARVVDINPVQAKVIIRHLTTIERLERLITIAEGRRNATLREIERHRAVLAQALRDKVQDVEDAEFNVVEPPAIAVPETKAA